MAVRMARYELRMPDGRLRVAGAFNHGKRIGSFLFWNAAGARIALLPFDDDAMNGTVALWYLAANAKTEAQAQARGRVCQRLLAGDTRSWYPDGRPRAEFRYDHGVLAEARAWSAKALSLSDAEARALAARDQASGRAVLQYARGDRPRQSAALRNEWEEAMKSSKRRHLLQTAVLMTAGDGCLRIRRRPRAQPRTPFGVPPTFIPIAGTADVFSGAAHLLHRPQLRRPCARDGLRPDARAAVLLPEADRCDPDRAAAARCDHPYPTLTKNYHYESRAGRGARQGRAQYPDRPGARPASTATRVGLDMTRRDLQRAMGDEKKPWEIGKSFDHSAPLGPLQPAAKTGPLHRRARSGSR